LKKKGGVESRRQEKHSDCFGRPRTRKEKTLKASAKSDFVTRGERKEGWGYLRQGDPRCQLPQRRDVHTPRARERISDCAAKGKNGGNRKGKRNAVKKFYTTRMDPGAGGDKGEVEEKTNSKKRDTGIEENPPIRDWLRRKHDKEGERGETLKTEESWSQKKKKKETFIAN